MNKVLGLCINLSISQIFDTFSIKAFDSQDNLSSKLQCCPVLPAQQTFFFFDEMKTLLLLDNATSNPKDIGANLEENNKKIRSK